MSDISQGAGRSFSPAAALLLALVFSPHALSAQVAGYRVGARGLDVRTTPCTQRESDLLCQPTGAVFLRIRNGTLIEIDSSWTRDTSTYFSAPDVWRQLQGRFVARFGTPDSVRTMNPLRLAGAYSEGLAVFWKKPGWCAVLTLKVAADRNGSFIPIDLKIEQLGAWRYECSVYPFLEP